MQNTSVLPEFEGFHLSPQQKRVWKLLEVQPGLLSASGIIINGDLDTRALRNSIQLMVARQEIFRTTFRKLPEYKMPLQVVNEPVDFAWEAIDLSSFTTDSQQKFLNEIEETNKTPFQDYSIAPLLYAKLIKLSNRQHKLMLRMPALYADKRAMMNIVLEIASCYEAICENKQLDDPLIPYINYSEWQNELISSSQIDNAESYIKNNILKDYQSIDLPFAVKPSTDYIKNTVAIAMPEEIVKKIENLTSTNSECLQVHLFACWQLLLSHLTEQEHILTAYVCDGREIDELKPSLGVFNKFLPVKTHILSGIKFNELIIDVNRSLNSAKKNQDRFSVDRYLEVANVYDTVIFPFGFEYIEWPAASPSGGVSFSLDNISAENDPYNIKLTCYRRGKYRVMLEFSSGTGVHSENMMSLFASYYMNLINQSIGSYSEKLAELELLNGPQKAHTIKVSQGLVFEYANLPFHKLFELVVERYPDRIAVTDGIRKLSFDELNKRANQLANYLHLHGVRADDKVCLLTDRTVDFIVALLGALKAGAAYAPLDPGSAIKRLEGQIANLKTPLLITSVKYRQQLSFYNGKLFCIDEDSCLEGFNNQNVNFKCYTSNLAYVLHTSGSTGIPKGIGVSHANAINYTGNILDLLGLNLAGTNEYWHFAMVSPTTTDLGNTSLFSALLSGGCLHIITQETAINSNMLLQYASTHHIDVLKIVPAHLSMLLSLQNSTKILPEKFLIVGGDVLTRELVQKVTRLKPLCKILNHYGPAETSVAALTQGVSELHSVMGYSLPIGAPLKNISVYLLDDNFEPVPIGVPGEMYIGGKGVGRGYINDPKRTAENYLPDPFSLDAGARLYKTGDRARYLPDHTLEFLGRRDNQLKIRGYRVELSEIEFCLREHPAIKEAIATFKNINETLYNLQVYCTLKQEFTLLADKELEEFIKSKLPEYMVPNRIIVLDALPLNNNGKVDRNALLEADNIVPKKREYLAPRNKLEQELVEMWQELLNQEIIGVNDSFFDLGGNSITAAIFVNKIQKKLEEVVYVMAVFDAPTIAQFATILKQQYPSAVGLNWPELGITAVETETELAPVSLNLVTQMRSIMKPAMSFDAFKNLSNTKEAKASPMVFILAPSRSGSTLLRVLLAGHSQLFSPPELELLNYVTLGERSAALSGRYSYALEGLLRAIMELKNLNSEQAKAYMIEYEKSDVFTKTFYQELQKWVGDRILVDKTPTYSMSLEVLQRAEIYFRDPLYIHLIRHPYSVIQSYINARLDQVRGGKFPFNARQQAELTWLVSHQNILEFLDDVPDKRKLRVNFEDLVKKPETSLQNICDFVGITYSPEMADLTKGTRMTDGLYTHSRMQGDNKFHGHKGINSEVADNWQQFPVNDKLCDLTKELSYRFGYSIVE